VQFAGFDIADLSRLPLKRVEELLAPYSKELSAPKRETLHPEKAMVVRRIAKDLIGRLSVLLDLGLGYLTIERSTPTLSPGELQRLRLATQVRSNLFGVVYVLDEPSAGLHPADTEALLRAFERLKVSGNSLFVVEHELDVVRRADWIVDVGPGAGEQGGQILYSGPRDGLAQVEGSRTRQYLFGNAGRIEATRRHPKDWLRVRAVTRNNLNRLDVDIPLGVFSCVTGISGSGKSSLVSQFLVETLTDKLGQRLSSSESTIEDFEEVVETLGGDVVDGMDHVKRLVVVDQKPIGRTPRSNLATYTGLFDHVRKLFASTKQARARRYDAGRFSFNIAKGRCATCEGEGFICVELLFLPSVYAPCPTCKGSRYNDKTLEIKIAGKSVADVLGMTVDEAFRFFAHDVGLQRSLGVIREVGLGYIKLGQSATELSGGEAQRIKLATELQRIQRGGTLYILDEPTTGLHPSDVEKLVRQLNSLVDGGSSVIVVEHDMMMVARSDWVIDMGPGAGDEGGLVVAVGPPTSVASVKESRTARYLKRALAEKVRDTQF
jgi:excinuclease ABC subunit A